MLPLQDDEETLIARLETRVAQLPNLLQSFHGRIEQLEKELRTARDERDAASSQVQALRVEVLRLQDEMVAMRAKQQDAATRVRGLLEQIDRLGLFEQSQES